LVEVIHLDPWINQLDPSGPISINQVQVECRVQYCRRIQMAGRRAGAVGRSRYRLL